MNALHLPAKSEKSAQNIMDILSNAGDSVRGGASRAKNSIQEWYAGLDPHMRDTVLNSLAGAAAGGALTGGMSAMGPKDPESNRGVLGPALLGALLGGTAGAGLTLGPRMLSGGVTLPGEQKRPLVARTMEALSKPLTSNPLLAAGATAGGLFNLRHGRPYQEAVEAAGGSTSYADKFRGLRDAFKNKDFSGIESAMSKRKGVMQGAKAMEATPYLKQLLAQGKDVQGALTKGKMAPFALPAGALAGYLADRYTRGDY